MAGRVPAHARTTDDPPPGSRPKPHRNGVPPGATGARTVRPGPPHGAGSRVPCPVGPPPQGDRPGTEGRTRARTGALGDGPRALARVRPRTASGAASVRFSAGRRRSPPASAEGARSDRGQKVPAPTADRRCPRVLADSRACWRPRHDCCACSRSSRPTATGADTSWPNASASPRAPYGATSTSCASSVTPCTPVPVRAAATSSVPGRRCRRCCWTTTRPSRWWSGCVPPRATGSRASARPRSVRSPRSNRCCRTG